MAELKVLESGLVFENPTPHLRSQVAYHPSLVRLSSQQLLCSFDVGEAVESLDYHTVVARSEDLGHSWNLEGPLLEHPPAHTSHSLRISRLRDGTLVGFGGLFDRSRAGDGLINRETSGYVPMNLVLTRSVDGGRYWSNLEMVNTPLSGPCWETCHPIVELSGGRWLAPTATWADWLGNSPEGEQAVVLISDTQGRDWLRFGRTFDGRTTGFKHWEQSVIELQDGRIFAIAWKYDPEAACSYPTVASVSEDDGVTFSEPVETGILGETCKVTQLADARLFGAYRRQDGTGLWGFLATLDGLSWKILTQAPLWAGGQFAEDSLSVGQMLSSLEFGYPSMVQLNSEELLLVFWCREACLTHIRWLRIQIGLSEETQD